MFFRVMVSVIMLLSAISVFAMDQRLRFERYSTYQGLSNTAVRAILQDQKGFLWVATEGGLNRFDGYSFKVFRADSKNPHSLSDDTIQALFLDSRGILWIGTRHGLNRYHYSSGRFESFFHDESNAASLSHNDIQAIAEDKQGHLWLATLGGGLNRFDVKSGKFTHFKHDPNDPESLSDDKVRAVSIADEGVVWAATNDGVTHFHPDTGTVTRITTPLINGKPTNIGLVDDVLIDSRSDVWLASNNGLYQYIQSSGQFIRYSTKSEKLKLIHDSVATLHEDDAGNLWGGTLGGGMFKITAERQAIFYYQHAYGELDSLSHNFVRTIEQDSNDIIWVGTSGGGLNKLNLEQQQFGHVKPRADNSDGLSGRDILSFLEDRRGGLWVGSLTGASRQTPGQRGFTAFEHEPDNPHSISHNIVYSIIEDEHNHIWFATFGGGLSRYNETTGLFKHFRHRSNDEQGLSTDNLFVLLKQQDYIWIGSFGGGLIRFNAITEEFQTYRANAEKSHSLNDDRVYSLISADSHKLWIGTYRGLNLLDTKTGKFTSYIDSSSNDNSTQRTIFSIAKAGDGGLWLGTSIGLLHFNPEDESYLNFSELNPSMQKEVYCALTDQQGLLWLAGSQGVDRFNPDTSEVRNYRIEDGLQSNEFNYGACYQNEAGELFIGGVNGFNRFDPKLLKDITTELKVELTDVLVFNKSVPIGQSDDALDNEYTLPAAIETLDAIELGHLENQVAFEFSTLNYRAPKHNQYAYRLDGYDGQWIVTDANNRRATYTHLPAGDYTLRLKAADANGYWSEQERMLKIRVNPPVWLTWWAISLYLVTALSSLVYGVYFVIRRKNERLLIEQLKEVDKLKDDFLAKMSHEIRTPMNAVIGLSRLALNARSDTERRDHINTVLDSSDSLLALINDILDFSKINAGQMSIEKIEFELNEVLTQTFNQCALKAHEQGLELVVGLDTPVPGKLFGDPLRLRQILVNLVNNAVKFTETGGVSITVRFTELSEGGVKLYCEVTDTGCGMTEQQQAKLFQSYVQADDSISRTHGGTGLGLAIAKQLCELMDGDIGVRSELGKGSTFYFSITLQEVLSETSGSLQFTGLKALVVDDIEFCAVAMAQQLSAVGIEAEYAVGGQQAIDKLKATEHCGCPYDLVVADWSMPGVDGIEVLHKLKQGASTPTMKLLMVGRYDKERFRREAQQQPFDVIDKPVLPDTLYKAIRKLASGESLSLEQAGQEVLVVPDLSDYRILLVEDNTINQQVAMGFLEYTGVAMDIAENGVVALHKLAEQQYDLVLMDIEMPQLNGIETCKRVRTELGLNELPIIAMTGHTLQGNAQRFNDAGMNGHLVKPLDQDLLYAEIGKWLAFGKKVDPVASSELPDFSGAKDCQSLVEGLKQLSLLDVDKALGRLGGKVSLYLDMVKEFHKTKNAIWSEINELYVNQSWQQLMSLTHTLKSSAAYVGAYKVAELSALVESECLNLGKLTTSPAQLVREVEQLWQQIDTIFGQQQDLSGQPQKQKQAFNLQTFKAQLEALNSLLCTSDFASEEMLAQMIIYCEGTPFAHDVDTMVEQVDEMEFEKAARLAQQMLTGID